MTVELVVAPSDDGVRDELARAPGWPGYETGLRRVLGHVLGDCGVERLEVGELLVAEPPPAPYADLRNGAWLDTAAAVDLVVRMVRGDGPYCSLSAPGGTSVQPGWDGAVHLAVGAATAGRLGGHEDPRVTVERRGVPEEPEPVEHPVRAVADAAFWAAAAEDADDRPAGVPVLLRERWAHGAYGCRWFRLTAENTPAVSRTVSARSLVTVVRGPRLHEAGAGAVPPEEVLDDDLVAFRPPLTPGELGHRAWPGGVGDVREVTGAGYSLVLSMPEALGRGGGARHAVVPDADGVVRMRWEDPSAD